MATVHLIFGHVGVGKTTFARRLESELPALRFTHDEWMARLYGSDPPAERFADCAARVSGLIDTLWPRCLALGLDVVLDLNFWTRRGRDEARRIAAGLGAAVRLYHLSCPEAEAWARVEARNTTLEGGLLITRPTFESLRGRVEPLGGDEDRIEAVSVPA